MLFFRTLTALFAILVATSLVYRFDDAAAASDREKTLLELMLTEVAPSTDTLWGADDPQSDEDWQVLADAANATIRAFEKAKAGGSGAHDDEWASGDDWQRYADDEIAAARLARAAIEARDIEALLAAGEPLYTPCEACHGDYHPGVR